MIEYFEDPLDRIAIYCGSDQSPLGTISPNLLLLLRATAAVHLSSLELNRYRHFIERLCRAAAPIHADDAYEGKERPSWSCSVSEIVPHLRLAAEVLRALPMDKLYFVESSRSSPNRKERSFLATSTPAELLEQHYHFRAESEQAINVLSHQYGRRGGSLWHFFLPELTLFDRSLRTATVQRRGLLVDYQPDFVAGADSEFMRGQQWSDALRNLVQLRLDVLRDEFSGLIDNALSTRVRGATPEVASFLSTYLSGYLGGLETGLMVALSQGSPDSEGLKTRLESLLATERDVFIATLKCVIS